MTFRIGFNKVVNLINYYARCRDYLMGKVCAIRGKHSWKRTNADVKHCRICGTPRHIKRRKVKVAYG